MKKIIIIILMFIGAGGTAQELYLEGGKTISSFDYKNSQGQELENLQSTSKTFMAMGYRRQIFVNNLDISIGGRYSGYGAIGSDNSLGNFMEWDLNYLEFNLGLDYKLFKIKKAKFYIKGIASAGFLLLGTQTFNNTVINLKDQDDFDKTLFDFRAGIGFSHPISEHLSFYVQYMHGKSLTLKEGNSNTSDQEELRIISDNVSFSLLINLSK